jgi:hypothetical protein
MTTNDDDPRSFQKNDYERKKVTRSLAKLVVGFSGWIKETR